jgi:hypothetical protein
MTTHATIYLQPACADCIRALDTNGEGRLWCEAPQDECPECGRPWVRYDLSETQIVQDEGDDQ